MTKGKKQKILILGLDGVTFDIIMPLVDKGYMPNLKNLIDRGFATELQSCIPPVTPPAWTSFMTGKNPGKHGVFDFRHYDRSCYSDSFVHSGHINEQTIWEILSEKGRRVGTVGLPLTYPPIPINGFMISGFETPSVNCDFTYPGELREEVLEIRPDFDFPYPSYNRLFPTERSLRDYMGEISSRFCQRKDVSLFLMDKFDWDVFMVQFQGTDTLQHDLWKYINPDGGDGVKSGIREIIWSGYTELDRNIGTILEKTGEDTTIMILSDHGFGSLYGHIYPNILLEKWGLLTLCHSEDGVGAGRMGELYRGVKKTFRESGVAFVRKFYHFVRKYLSKRERESWIDTERNRSFDAELPVDWSQTKACVTTAELCGFVYCNVLGREPQGLVTPGEEYERLCDDLIDRFSNLRMPHSQEPVFEAVCRGNELYEASQDVAIPDLVLIPREGCAVSRISPDNGNFLEIYPDEDEATHRMNGILIAAGPDVLIGHENIGARLIDIAPTLLAILGLPIPTDMDGQVLCSLFSRSLDITYCAPTARRWERREVYSEEEARILERRLKALGYLS